MNALQPDSDPRLFSTAAMVNPLARWTGYALLLGMVLCWSSGFIGYRYATQYGGVLVVTFWRFLFTVVLLLPFVFASLRQVGWPALRRHALLGVLGIAGYIAPLAKSIEAGVAPGTSSLIANLLPLSIVLMAGLVPGQRTRGWQWLGVAVCLSGMLIASIGTVELASAPVWAYCLPLLAVASLAVATIHEKRSEPVQLPALTGLFIQVCATLPVFALLAWQEGSLQPTLAPGFALAAAWLAIAGTLGGYGFYWLCLRRFSIQRISGALFLTPGITMIWACLQFGDPLTASALIGVGLTLIGLPLLRRSVIVRKP